LANLVRERSKGRRGEEAVGEREGRGKKHPSA